MMKMPEPITKVKNAPTWAKSAVGRLKTDKRFRRRALIIAAIALVVLAAVISLIVTFARGASTSTVKSATVEVGNVSTTVEGTGTLAYGTACDVSAPVGVMIDEVYVSIGDEVSEGQTLASVDKASAASVLLDVNSKLSAAQSSRASVSGATPSSDNTSYLKYLVYQKQCEDLERVRSLLTAMIDDPVIKATGAGTIDTANVSAGSEISLANGSSGQATSGSGGTAQGSVTPASQAMTSALVLQPASYVIASGSSANANLRLVTASKTTPSVSVEKNPPNSTAPSTGKGDGDAAGSDNGEDKNSNNANDKNGDKNGDASQKGNALQLDIEAPKAGEKPPTSIKLAADAPFTASLGWNCTSPTFETDTSYTATLVLTARGDYSFPAAIVPKVPGATVEWKLLANEGGAENKVLYVTAKFGKTGASDKGSDTPGTNASSSSGKQGGSAGSTPSGGSAGASAGSAGASASSGASSADTSANQYASLVAPAFTIASEDDMQVTISVDEADILSVKTDQSATVTIDALEGETFEGKITNVSAESSSSGGSVKYSATITIPKAEGMLAGMSASASIITSSATDVLLIPAGALQQRGNETFVYAELDSSGQPAGEVVVETGLSNGSQVEVTSGLASGDTVYYIEVNKSSSSGFDRRGSGGLGMGNMMGGPGGNPPSGGPDGGPSGPGGN